MKTELDAEDLLRRLGLAIKRINELEAERDRLPANWFEDSSLETWFPLTADELARTKASNTRLREALKSVLEVADRNTNVFNAARAALKDA